MITKHHPTSSSSPVSLSTPINDDNNDDNDNSNIDLQQHVNNLNVKALNDEYEQVLRDNEIEWIAIQSSVRQSALLSVIFMAFYLSIGCWYFGSKEGMHWSIRDSLIFAVYTITTVGYGYHDIPNDVEVQLFVIVYAFVGIAAVTTLLSQAYQFVKLEAMRVVRETSNNNVNANVTAASAVVVAVHADNEIRVGRSSSSSRSLFQQLIASIKRFFKHDKYGKVVKFLLPFFGQWFFGAIVVGSIEGWGAIESLYWAAVSLTTIGYGDLYPTKNASIWFCIFYLPVSLGFLSFFLANVANIYVKLHHKNTVRIERAMRSKLVLKRRRNRNRKEVNKEENETSDNYTDKTTINNNQRNKNDNDRQRRRLSSSGDDMDDDHDHIVNYGEPPQDYQDGSSAMTMSFVALPTGDIEKGTDSAVGRRPNNIFVGRSDGGQYYRDRVISLCSKNSNRFNESKSFQASSSRPPTIDCSISSMRSIIDAIDSKEKLNETSEGLSSLNDDSISKPPSEALDYDQSNNQPSFVLRVQIQERLARIVAIEVCGYHSKAEIKDNTFCMSLRSIRDVMDKWIIPNRARSAFRAVAFDAIFYVGERQLIIDGPNALFALSPREFQGLFSPVLAAIGSEEVLQSWLLATNLMADVELKGDDPIASGFLT